MRKKYVPIAANNRTKAIMYYENPFCIHSGMSLQKGAFLVRYGFNSSHKSIKIKVSTLL